MEPVLVVLFSSSLAAAVSAAGALPFAARPASRPRLVGTADALASGLMLGAGYLLMSVGLDRNELLALAGAGLGVGYTHWIQAYAGTAELDAENTDATSLEYGYKLLLQQTLHSASEGAAIGFAMVLELKMGIFVAVALGLHNIAEGIALSEVLRRRGLSFRESSALCVVTKLSQPLLALATFALAPILTELLAAGLGFAAGCLLLLVLTELLPGSYRRAETMPIAALVTLAAGGVVLAEELLA